MDTAAFLKKILPSKGVYVSAEFSHGLNKAPRHAAHENIEDMARTVLQADERGNNVFHACASFKEVKVKGMRVADNAAFVRSQWIDVDCGDGKDYANQKDACAAVLRFCAASDLPTPMFVSSGRGVHCYWTFTQNIPAEIASRSMKAFLALTRAQGLKHDRSRTTDLASILRPVGANWRKEKPCRPVKVLRDAESVDFKNFVTRIKSATQTAGPLPLPPKATSKKSTGVNAFAAFETNEFPPSSAVEIIKKCQTLRFIATNPNDVKEPEWHLMLGLVKHTVEGEPLAHQWSSGYDHYDAEETQAKLDRWTTGPTTCDRFGESSTRCEGCVHQGKIKSPIVLGYKTEVQSAPEPKAKTPELHVKDLMQFARKMPGDLTEWWPKQYHWDGTSMRRSFVNEDGVTEYVAFANTYFYPFMRFYMEDGTAGIRICHLVRPGKWRIFEIPAQKAVDGHATATALAAHEIFAVGKNGKLLMSQYIIDALAQLQVRGIEAQTYGAFGWADDGFVIGREKITEDGDRPTLLSERVAEELRTEFGVRGTAEGWADAIDRIYNRPGAEPYQFLMCASFGSPLIQLLEYTNWHGVPIALTGQSGLGKTTTCQVACSIFGHPRHLTLTARSEGATLNGMIQRVAVMRNMPIIMDEMTGRSLEEVRGLLFSLSNGKPKIRLKGDGLPIDTGALWNLVSFITGNVNITEMLSQQDTRVAEATQVRCFEIILPENFNSKVFEGVDAKHEIDTLLHEQYGAAGREYLRYVLKHREKLRIKFVEFRKRFGANTQEETQERFFYDLIATAMLGGAIAQKLGLIKFDLAAVERWARNHVRTLRSWRRTTNRAPSDQLHDFLSSLYSRTVVTRRYPDTRGLADKSPVEIPQEILRASPVARIATEDRRFFVTVRAFTEWCTENKVSPAILKNELDGLNYFVHRGNDDPIQLQKLFRGTDVPGTRTRVFELNYDLVRGNEIAQTHLQLVKKLGGEV